jgi:hypothetical protein
MAYKTDRNVIGRQVTSSVEEVITAIRVMADSGSLMTLVVPAAFTRANLVELFNGLPTVTTSNTLTITGTAGNATVTTGERAIATGKGWTLSAAPGG